MTLQNRLLSAHWEHEQLEICGRVQAHQGEVIRAVMPGLAVGDYCEIASRYGSPIPAQVVSFEGSVVLLAPLIDPDGVVPHATVRSWRRPLALSIPNNPRGLVVDALGKVVTRVAAPKELRSRVVLPHGAPPKCLSRPMISSQLMTGVRGIDALCPIGVGQRLGLFAPPGVGKSTLLSMLVSGASVDHVVVGLIGERGREVGEFVHHSLGERGMAQATVVASTSDESPLRRVMAAYTATAIAESLRDEGKHVLLVIDSLTRTARAMRDLSLSRREIPVRQGFTPSVYAELPKLLERAGTAEQGSITAVYSVLTNDSDAERDALGEEVRSILDGHILLDKAVALRGVRPAIDYLGSISRLAGVLHTDESAAAAAGILRILQRLKSDRDIVLLGGTPDDELRVALAAEPSINTFLHQKASERIYSGREDLLALHGVIRDQIERANGAERSTGSPKT